MEKKTRPNGLGASSDGSTTTRDSLEARLDVGHCSSGATSFAQQEKQTSLLLQQCLRRSTSLACHVFLCFIQTQVLLLVSLKEKQLTDILSQHTLDLFLLEATFDDQLIVCIHRATRAQFRQQEGLHVLGQTMQSGEKKHNYSERQQENTTYDLQISMKLANEVFLVPTRKTCGGRMTNFFLTPDSDSGFFSLILL